MASCDKDYNEIGGDLLEITILNSINNRSAYLATIKKQEIQSII
jgi:hypothetical protein